MTRSNVSIGLYYPKTGIKHASGLAIYTKELARALGELTDVTVYSGVDGSGPPSVGACDFVGIPPADDRYAELLQQATSLLAHDDALSLDVLVRGIRRGVVDHIDRTTDVLLNCYYLDDVLLSHLVDVPVVYQYHGLPSVGIGGKARERLSRTTYHLANSRTTAREVEQKLGRTVDGVVTPGVDVDRFTPDAEPAFSAEEPVVTFAGRFVESKGIFELLTAFDAISDQAHLCLVGDGEGGLSRQSQVGRRLRALGLEDEVSVLGEVPHDEMHRYYAASDVVCYPTHYESFGLVNVEAMACGVPVVSTTVSGVEEYATHGENSLLVPPGDATALEAALRRLVASPELRDRLGRAARETAERHSWNVQANAFLDYCTEVVLE